MKIMFIVNKVIINNNNTAKINNNVALLHLQLKGGGKKEIGTSLYLSIEPEALCIYQLNGRKSIQIKMISFCTSPPPCV